MVKKKGWKVLRTHRRSAVVNGSGILKHYPVGETVVRDPDIGPLFVFDSFEAAEKFNCGCSSIVVPCEYVPAEDCALVDYFACTKSRLVSFIHCYAFTVDPSWPKGTVFAESVTCLE